ncbi:MarR family winged helix-turn-helix transcriptional regulator [Devosia psychrophila]|uniref:DNA-binding transcriptional regulator, MarR family n=2 Tax=Devosia psychrophila TaxID=728005 RepID=A0A1I1QWC1_9HYPH|nr:MarR family transcriptional regulator [Devosia psychrophila]SFD26444.1 DNA-binding transcriptional regulator, MarR family [Devosia psychrophila]
MAKYFMGSLRQTGDGRLPSLGEIGLNQFAPYLINRLSASYNAHLQDVLKSNGMTTAKMRALSILTISPSLTVNELAYLAVVEQSTMSRTLDALEGQGYVRRQSRSDDMRVRELYITDLGRAAFAESWPLLYSLYADLFEGVDAEEYDRFIDTMHKVLRNMHRRLEGDTTADEVPAD